MANADKDSVSTEFSSRIAGSGTLILSNGVDAPMRMTRVPQVALVHEVLIDQVEVNQILAHRDGQAPPES